ncbi:hypothetical protein [Achromobacter pestifer]
MSTYYAKENVSSCEIAGAVAAAALHDLDINLFALPAFPGIQVDEVDKENFRISMFVQTQKGVASQSFVLSRPEAFNAARKLKKTKGHEDNLMDRVQEAIAQLERAYSEAKR